MNPERPHSCYYHTDVVFIFRIQLHGIMSITFVLHYCVSHSVLFTGILFYFYFVLLSLRRFELLLSFQLQNSVLAASTPSFSNSYLSTLSKTGMSCHHVTIVLAFSACPKTRPAIPDTCLLLNFPAPMQTFMFLLLSRFLTQDIQERNATASTERPIDSQQVLCAREVGFSPKICQFEPHSGSCACV